jgi:hypothetical protein
MVWVGEREITMSRGWLVQYEDGSVICEEDMNWNKVPKKKNIKKVLLKWEDRLWSIDNQEHYTAPTKRGYVDISPAGHVSDQMVDSRAIGYYDVQGGCKVFLRVSEATGQMSWETVPCK